VSASKISKSDSSDMHRLLTSSAETCTFSTRPHTDELNHGQTAIHIRGLNFNTALPSFSHSGMPTSSLQWGEHSFIDIQTTYSISWLARAMLVPKSWASVISISALQWCVQKTIKTMINLTGIKTRSITRQKQNKSLSYKMERDISVEIHISFGFWVQCFRRP